LNILDKKALSHVPITIVKLRTCPAAKGNTPVFVESVREKQWLGRRLLLGGTLLQVTVIVTAVL
jgi:hypothetical protein